MNWDKFIFSEQPKQRFFRHAVFWLLWWLYFTVSYFHYGQTGLKNTLFEPWSIVFVIKSLLLLSVHAMACYYFIGYLMPQYFFNQRYGILSAHTFLLALMILAVVYGMHKYIFPVIDETWSGSPPSPPKNLVWTSITSGLLSSPKVILAAVTIKLLKRWWLKQKEKEKLEQEKLSTDVQLLKSQIHPELLFSSLQHIATLTQKKQSDRAAAVLLKLADILSYMLYECDTAFVPLDKEIKAVLDYLTIKKSIMGHSLELDIAIKGQTGNQLIAPMILYGLIEDSLAYSANNKKTDQPWLNIDMQTDTHSILLKLIQGASEAPETTQDANNITEKTKKRLSVLYPEQYELKTTIEPEIMMTVLKIETTGYDHATGNICYPSKPGAYAIA